MSAIADDDLLQRYWPPPVSTCMAHLQTDTVRDAVGYTNDRRARVASSCSGEAPYFGHVAHAEFALLTTVFLIYAQGLFRLGKRGTFSVSRAESR